VSPFFDGHYPDAGQIIFDADLFGLVGVHFLKGLVVIFSFRQ
jgi:hypothetical protein